MSLSAPIRTRDDTRHAWRRLWRWVVVMRACETCGGTLEGLRPLAKYCSPRCRSAAARERRRAAAHSVPAEEHALVAAVRRELTDAKVVDTADGQLALRLADQVAVSTGAALTKLVEELRRARADAMTNTPAVSPGPPSSEDDVQRARRLPAEARAAAGFDPGPTS